MFYTLRVAKKMPFDANCVGMIGNVENKLLTLNCKNLKIKNEINRITHQKLYK